MSGMLRVTQLPIVLGQLTDPRPAHPDLPAGSNQGRVLGALLMSRHGALLGTSGFDQGGTGESTTVPSAKVLAAISSNVWSDFAPGLASNSSSGGDIQPPVGGGGLTHTRGGVGHQSYQGGQGGEGQLQVLLLELEQGQVAVAGVCEGRFLLGAYADAALSSGLLKSKMMALVAYLDAELSTLQTAD
mmetsp:Transcript_22063/g.49927  ORF Transcript_22063/g.49927 Transcript_22063/m.49927 type:complete len:187 (+) Transcript_22063:241-801(+)|eukprot:CAMPEP_0172605482 /NCGR_PEP_ID=MMETSP1068-20121228/25725_1 /TAXON_ID=35684 /ORGANISM="Pseudopedinella elastica, Strain CCMP716" /LENGTH=186 /DNA_ID=CAMNT_0013407905 /DNA_START=193 /DNA_END=753 /DNA_ORIENTATION=+